MTTQVGVAVKVPAARFNVQSPAAFGVVELIHEPDWDEIEQDVLELGVKVARTTFSVTAVVWVEPSGKTKPPVPEATVPCTVKVEVGFVVPIPTLLPLTARGLFPSAVPPVHSGMKLAVPLPVLAVVVVGLRAVLMQ